jgi:hypothetical protein
LLSDSIVARWAHKCHGYDDCFIAQCEPCGSEGISAKLGSHVLKLLARVARLG